MCKMCATGADIQSRVKEIRLSGKVIEPDPFIDDALAVGKHFHKFCPGKYSCTCQHHDVKQPLPVTENVD